MAKMFLRSEYAYDMNAVTLETALFCLDDSLTQQHEADDADINVLVARFGLTGQLPQGVQVPSFGDFEGISDFKSAVDVVRDAAESFMQFPAELRARFSNDPQKFLEFVHDDRNRDEAVKWGLVLPAAQALAPVQAIAGSSGGSVVDPKAPSDVSSKA